jgi:hypothetical protein
VPHSTGRTAFATVLPGSRPGAAATPHTTATASPIDGRYEYRSAIDWKPDWAMPLTGSSAMRNHASPTVTYGHRRRAATQSLTNPAMNTADPATCHAGQPSTGGTYTAESRIGTSSLAT